MVPASPEPATTTSDSPIDSIDPGWTRVDLGAPPNVSLTGAYAGPQGLVITAGVYGATGSEGFTWTSADARTWTFSTTPGPMAPSIGASIGDLEVMVGAGETSRCAHPFGETTWARRAGGPWLAAPFQILFCAGGAPQLAAGGGRFVVAGSGTGDQPFAWWSVDGLVWHDVPPPADPFPLVRGLTWDGGMFWMVARGESDVLVRTSLDGVSWTSWSILAGTARADPIALLPLDGRPILVTGGARANVSRLVVNGGAPVALDRNPLGEDPEWGLGFASTSGRLYLNLRTAAGPLLMTSRDGTRWDIVDLPPLKGFFVAGLADDGTNLLIVGGVEDPVGSTTGSSWIGTSPSSR